MLGTRIQRWIRQSHHLCEKNIVKWIKCKIEECQGRQQKAPHFPQAREKILETQKLENWFCMTSLSVAMRLIYFTCVHRPRTCRAPCSAVLFLSFLRVWAIYISVYVCHNTYFVIHEQLKRPFWTHRQGWQQAALLNLTIVTVLFELLFFFSLMLLLLQRIMLAHFFPLDSHCCRSSIITKRGRRNSTQGRHYFLPISLRKSNLSWEGETAFRLKEVIYNKKASASSSLLDAKLLKTPLFFVVVFF